MRKTQHLPNIRIRNFRGLSEICLEEFGSFNLLLGANDIGKTSVLEAVFLLTGFGAMDLSVRLQNRRKFLIRGFNDLAYLFHRLNIDNPVELSSENIDLNNERTIILTVSYADQATVNATQDMTKGHIGGNQDSILLPSTVSRAPHALKCDWRAKSDSSELIAYSGKLTVQSDGTLHIDPAPNENMARLSASNSAIAWFQGPGISCDAEVIGHVLVNKRKSDLLNVLRKIDPAILDISVGGDTVYLDIGLNKMIPLNMFGSGLVRSAGIISHCIAANSKILLIDEIENGLHYESIGPVLESLLMLSEEQGLQIFATTHSIGILEKFRDVLNGEKYDGFRDLAACYTLVKDKIGTVRSYRYNYKQFDHCIKAGIEIR